MKILLTMIIGLTSFLCNADLFSQKNNLSVTTVDFCKSWLEITAYQKEGCFAKIPDSAYPISCRLISLTVGNPPIQQKMVYLELDNPRSNETNAFLFIEESLNSFDYLGNAHNKPIYRLHQNAIYINKSTGKIDGILESSLVPLFNIDDIAGFKQFIRNIRTKHNNAFTDFQIRKPNYQSWEKLVSDELRLIKQHIINYDLKNNEMKKYLGTIPNELSVTVMPFQKNSNRFTYLYNNTNPYRVIRHIKLNADGKIDNIQTLQSPGAVNNPEIQWIDYRYNPDGGNTLYEMEKGYFDFINKYGFKIVI